MTNEEVHDNFTVYKTQGLNTGNVHKTKYLPVATLSTLGVRGTNLVSCS